ncbi:MAG: efflux RND transporter permease subunit [Candidatus Melainabacteria bacterium]|nr:efflux RND transporter permease subunit [Candidatus Melainabacteria bacterium]MBX9673595.1 CusA/CzcA family heavy metal efflux RND transporter [Candidatus Obscuribacterales bacterium]
MIERLISFALKQRLLIIAMAVGMSIWGVFSILSLPVDSFPDVSNVQVQIITEPEAMATEEVEALITYPIENALNGLPKIKKIRSASSFGLSVVTAIFEDDCDVYFARNLVQQRLTQVESSLPKDSVKPQLGPVISSFSQVFMYYLESQNHDNIDLRTIQDWFISRKLRSVPGVANVSTFGGFVKQYQVLIDPYRLHGFKLTLKDVVFALGNNNRNAGGNFIENAGEEVVIRGIGRIEDVSDIENIVLKEVDGTPVTVGRVAHVVVGKAFRRGSASYNGKGEVVTGIVLTRKGVNTKEVVEKVKAKFDEIQKELPRGVRMVPYYDQTQLVTKTIETVEEILLFSGGLVIIILTAVLMHIPSALIVSVIIPLSMLFSFICMKYTGLTANLMTLGAVDFGIIVDAGVVMVENIFRHLAHDGDNLQGPDGKTDLKKLVKSIGMAAKEVGRPIVFAIAIIVAVYLPLFTLEGIEGKMFHPLALTFVYALVGSLICSLTLIPVLCFFFMRKKLVEKHNPVLVWISDRYMPLLNTALNKPIKTLLAAVIGLVVAGAVLPFLGSEFIPSLDEGPILLRTKLPASVSHEDSRRVASAIESMMHDFPEVTEVVSRTGRSGTGPGLDGVESTDIYIGLKPRDKWQTCHNKEELVDKMAAKLKSVPGLMFSFSQPIADMIDDLVAGIRADLGVKIFGDDVDKLDSIAQSIKSEISSVRGAVDMQREQILGLPQLKIKIDRKMIARHGLNADDVLDVVQTALAGAEVTEVVEGTKRFGLLVRFMQDYRDTQEQIEMMLLDAPDGAKVPLKQLAHVTTERGLVAVNREEGTRRTAVLANVRGRDLGSFVAEAQEKVAKNVEIPRGYKVVWSGQFENQQRAMARLAVVVPIVLLLIFLLLFASFNSLRNAGLIMMNVPFAMIGGILALFISRQTLSVPAIIGFIALFGVAVQNGVILVSYIMQMQKQGMTVRESVIEGAKVRLRPVLMTALVAVVGLLPKIFSTGTGAEVQRPLATVVLGGLITATLLTLVVLPAVYCLINKDKTENG